MAAKAFEVEPMRNSVSAVAGLLAATSALPSPAAHSALSRETIAIPAPGVLVSFKTFSIAACSSGMDLGPLLVALSAPNAPQAAIATDNHTSAVAIRCPVRAIAKMDEYGDAGLAGENAGSEAGLRLTFANVLGGNGSRQ